MYMQELHTSMASHQGHKASVQRVDILNQRVFFGANPLSKSVRPLLTYGTQRSDITKMCQHFHLKTSFHSWIMDHNG